MSNTETRINIKRDSWPYDGECRESGIEHCQHIINHEETESEDLVNLARDHLFLLEQFGKLWWLHQNLAEKYKVLKTMSYKA